MPWRVLAYLGALAAPSHTSFLNSITCTPLQCTSGCQSHDKAELQANPCQCQLPVFFYGDPPKLLLNWPLLTYSWYSCRSCALVACAQTLLGRDNAFAHADWPSFPYSLSTFNSQICLPCASAACAQILLGPDNAFACADWPPFPYNLSTFTSQICLPCALAACAQILLGRDNAFARAVARGDVGENAPILKAVEYDLQVRFLVVRQTVLAVSIGGLWLGS